MVRSGCGPPADVRPWSSVCWGFESISMLLPLLMLSPLNCKPKVSQVRLGSARFFPPSRAGSLLPALCQSRSGSTRFQARLIGKGGGVRWIPPPASACPSVHMCSAREGLRRDAHGPLFLHGPEADAYRRAPSFPEGCSRDASDSPWFESEGSRCHTLRRSRGPRPRTYR